MFLGDYYVKNFARRDKVSGELLEFKNYDSYFEKDFSSYEKMIEWCNTSPIEEVRGYILNQLQKRIDKKNLQSAPATIELYTCDLPPIKYFKSLFGSYKEACLKCGTKPMFGDNLPKDFSKDCSKAKIYIDTREQKSLSFINSEQMKLDVGDYAIGGDDFNYTFVDRKSFSDLCSTLSSDYKRFVREFQRCRSLGVFLFVVIECDLYQMQQINAKSPKKFNLHHVYRNMREIQNQFQDCCQFVFSGSRSNSEILIPKLLTFGPKIWRVDIQYFLDNKLINLN
jgi:hypothetical protein